MKKIIFSLLITLSVGVILNAVKSPVLARGRAGNPACEWIIAIGTPNGGYCVIKAGCDPAVTDCDTYVSQHGCNSSPSTCNAAVTPFDPTCDYNRDGDPDGIDTALGCLPTEPQAFVNLFLPWAIGVGGAIAFLLMLWGVFLNIVSAGNPEKMQAGGEMITSAIAGLLIIIFAVFILRFIGVDVLGLF